MNCSSRALSTAKLSRSCTTSAWQAGCKQQGGEEAGKAACQ